MASEYEFEWTLTVCTNCGRLYGARTRSDGPPRPFGTNADCPCGQPAFREYDW